MYLLCLALYYPTSYSPNNALYLPNKDPIDSLVCLFQHSSLTPSSSLSSFPLSLPPSLSPSLPPSLPLPLSPSFPLPFQRHGKGVLVFASGERYSGDVSYDMISGEGEMVYTDDCRYIGQWMNGLVSGECDSANKARFRNCSLYL